MNEREEVREEITEELKRLTLKQRELEGQQKELNRALKINCIRIGQATLRLTQERSPDRERPPQPRHELIPYSGIREGDPVKVTNLSKGQEKKGRASGITKNGLIKVSTASGRVIKRLPKNLRVVRVERVKQDAYGDGE